MDYKKTILISVCSISVITFLFFSYRFYQLSDLVIKHESQLKELQQRFPELVIQVINEAIKQQQSTAPTPVKK